MAVKHKELKHLSKPNITSLCAIDVINNILSCFSYMMILSASFLISRKLLELKDMSRDYLLDVYDTKELYRKPNSITVKMLQLLIILLIFFPISNKIEKQSI